MIAIIEFEDCYWCPHCEFSEFASENPYCALNCEVQEKGIPEDCPLRLEEQNIDD